MKMSDAFPSKFLKAADLQGRHVDVEISHVEMEDLGDDTKPVVYFVGKTKGLVLNKTNGSTIADDYGDESDAWVGRIITLFATKVDYQGKRTDAIRVSIPRDTKVDTPAPAQPKTTPKKAAAAPVKNGVDDDQVIPF